MGEGRTPTQTQWAAHRPVHPEAKSARKDRNMVDAARFLPDPAEGFHEMLC